MVERKNQAALEIVTLGNFRVKAGDRILTQDANRAYHLWELFKYLLTQRGQEILPEVLVNVLWPKEEYEDPKCVVRSLIYRLRQLLPRANGEENTHYISCGQGGYCWNVSGDYWLDAQEFEDLCRKAQACLAEDPALATELLERALTYYKGEYLPETAFYDWAFPQRHYYRRLYLEGFITLTNLLRAAGRPEEIISLCEGAIQIDPLEEEFHIPFMEALLAMGRRKQALSHYHYITAALYRELGVKPSGPMRHLYRCLKSGEDSGEDLGSVSIAGPSLGTSGKEGEAFYCDPSVFRSIYQLEQRRAERKGQQVTLGIATLTQRIPLGFSSLQEAMEVLQRIILTCLRKEDVITRWSENKILILLGTAPPGARGALRRIEDNFRKSYKDKNRFLLNIRLEAPFFVEMAEDCAQRGEV